MSSTDSDLRTRYSRRVKNKKVEKDLKADFSRRLNLVLDESPLGIPAKGQGRQTFVAKLFGVGQKAARKWLEGEGYPEMEKSIEIALRLNVALEWLLTGRGDKRMVDQSDHQLAELLNQWFQMPEPLKTELMTYSKFLIEKLKTNPIPPGASMPGEKLSVKKPH